MKKERFERIITELKTSKQIIIIFRILKLTDNQRQEVINTLVVAIKENRVIDIDVAKTVITQEQYKQLGEALKHNLSVKRIKYDKGSKTCVMRLPEKSESLDEAKRRLDEAKRRDELMAVFLEDNTGPQAQPIGTPLLFSASNKDPNGVNNDPAASLGLGSVQASAALARQRPQPWQLQSRL